MSVSLYHRLTFRACAFTQCINRKNKSATSVSSRICGVRHLLSDATTNIESYSRQRLFRMDILGEEGKANLFNILQNFSSVQEARKSIPIIMDSFHVANTDQECDVIEDTLRFLRSGKGGDAREFHFGAILFRMCHYLGLSNRAFALYKDQQLHSYFKDNTCHMILMDLLYKHKQYHEVLQVFSSLQRFDTNCYTLACGALFHINTPESLRQSEYLLEQLKNSNHALQRRALVFCALLAVNQGEVNTALNRLRLCKPNNLTKNTKLLCSCRLHQSQTIFNLLNDFLKAAKNSKQLTTARIFKDTWSEVQQEMNRDESDKKRLEDLEFQLGKYGVLSPQNTSIFLERIILGDKDYKRERAKRLIERSSANNKKSL